MIKAVTTELHLNPQYVVSVNVNASYDTLTITMHDGKEHHLGADFRKSIWETQSRIVALLFDDPQPSR